MKQKIVEFLNQELGETFEVIDIFKTTSDTDGMLTYCGYRHLKHFYEFHIVDVNFSNTLLNNIVLFSKIKGLYYITTNAMERDVKRIYSTDKTFLNRLKMYNKDFDLYAKRMYEKKS